MFVAPNQKRGLPRATIETPILADIFPWCFKAACFLICLAEELFFCGVTTMLEMLVHGVNLDVMTNQPVIVLKDAEAHRFLPIWIGQFEATAILMEIQGIKPSRPLTHDLLKAVIESLEAKVVKVVVNDLKEGTFYARVHLIKGSEPFEIDARPSDAIALAVRTKSPIYASEKVIEKASIVSETGEEEEVERFKEFLEDVEPEDFKE